MIKRVFSVDEQRTLLELCWQFEDAWEHGDCQSASEWLNANYSESSEAIDLITALAELKLVELELRPKYETHRVEGTLHKSQNQLMRFPKPEIAQPENERYKFLREIARGGAGVVWHVFDLQLLRFSAIKLLLDSQDNSEMRRRLTLEARICASLQHPGIVPIHELSALNDGRPFINMKLIDGKTLEAILAEADSNQQKNLLRIFRHVCAAISYAHSQGVIHRDIKPSNIMVGAFDEVQIMDWGLAKVVQCERTTKRSEIVQTDVCIESSSSVSLSSGTQVGSIFGTLAYMSPEQARGEHELVGKRADVFALGGVLCKILTGSPVYMESNLAELRTMACTGNTAQAIARIRKSRASKAIKSLAIASINSDPNKRPSNAQDLVRALDHIAVAEEWRKRACFILLALAM